jgi:hypothetical protein
MNRTPHIRRLPSLVATLLIAAGAASAQPAAKPAAGAGPTSVYAPTSLAVARDTPRTRDGHPDLQGVVWDAKFFAPLQIAPKLGPDLVIPEAAARKAYEAYVAPIIKAPFLALDPEAGDLLASAQGFPLVRGQRRTRLLVLPADGKLPLTPAAVKEGQAPGGDRNKADNPENRNTLERCLAFGGAPPMAMLAQISPWEFVQTRDHLVIHTEYGDEVRIAPFAETHGSAATRPALGDSIARWEGDTLVVETTHFLARDRSRGSLGGSMIVNPDARVIERFTRVSKDELVYQFTIVDPTVYAAPWLAEYSLYRAPYRMFSSSCHEGNYGLPNILAGARQEERNAAAKAPATGPAS